MKPRVRLETQKSRLATEETESATNPDAAVPTLTARAAGPVLPPVTAASPPEDAFKVKLASAFGCKASETALALLDQVSSLDHAVPDTDPAAVTRMRLTAMAQLAELQPATAVEAMLAAQMVGTHRLALTFLARATTPAAAIALRTGVDIDPARLRGELNAMLSSSMQLSLVEILPWERFPIGITGKTLKRIFCEKTEPHVVAQANRPVGLEPPDRSLGRRAPGEGGET